MIELLSDLTAQSFPERLTAWLDALPKPWQWVALLLPLLLTVAAVYKGIKVDGTAAVTSQTVRMFTVVCVVMGGIAGMLYVVVRHLN